MVKRTFPTNPQLRKLIVDMKILSIQKNIPLWKRIAEDLEKPTRQRREVNLFHLDKVTENNETVIVPGKVLGTGTLNHSLTIAAWKFSKSALEELKKSKSKTLTIEDLMKENLKGKSVRIIG